MSTINCKVVIDKYSWNSDDIMSGNMEVQKSMISETLDADILTVTINSALTNVWSSSSVARQPSSIISQLRRPQDISAFKYGDPIYYYHGTTLMGKFYIKRVEQQAKNLYYVYAISAVGLLSDQTHMGGIWTSPTAFTTILSSVMGSIPYSIDSASQTAVNALRVTGLLKIQSRQSALRQLMFPYGLSIMKDEFGVVKIGYNNPTVPKNIDKDNMRMGSSINYLTPASVIRITEHTYAQSSTTEDEVLYDNTSSAVAAEHQVIEFSDPMHTLTTTGSLTVEESNCNYAIVNGIGQLSGKKYIHVTRQLEQSTGTGVTTEAREINCTDAYLINTLNSYSCLARMADYYRQAREAKVNFEPTNEICGDLVTINSPWEYHTSSPINGYLKNMSLDMGGDLEAESNVTINWRPTHLGNNFDNYIVVKRSDLVNDTWTVPTAMRGKRAQVVLFGGAQGGQGGYAGSQGGTSTGQDTGTNVTIISHSGRTHTPTLGGNPGQAAHGGTPGKVIAFDIPSLANSYSVHLGAGGLGGAGGVNYRLNYGRYLDGVTVDPEDGYYGEDSTFGSYTTATGTTITNYVNLVDGTLFATTGSDSLASAGKGGDGVGSYSTSGDKFSTDTYEDASTRALAAWNTWTTSTGVGNRGGSITVNGTTYTGGNPQGGGGWCDYKSGYRAWGVFGPVKGAASGGAAAGSNSPACNPFYHTSNGDERFLTRVGYTGWTDDGLTMGEINDWYRKTGKDVTYFYLAGSTTLGTADEYKRYTLPSTFTDTSYVVDYNYGTGGLLVKESSGSQVYRLVVGSVSTFNGKSVRLFINQLSTYYTSSSNTSISMPTAGRGADAVLIPPQADLGKGGTGGYPGGGGGGVPGSVGPSGSNGSSGNTYHSVHLGGTGGSGSRGGQGSDGVALIYYQS